MTPFDWLTAKTLSLVQILGPISNASWVIVIFVWKFPNFCYHGNRGRSDTNFTYTVKYPGNKGGSSKNLDDSIRLADCQNPQFVAKFWDLSLMRAELLWFLCGNFLIFITMATGVVLNRDDILCTSWVIADLLFFSNFCYHGNKVGSCKNLSDSVWLADPKPSVWCKILGPILNASWVIVIFVWKFPNFCYHGNRGRSDTNFTYTVKYPENPLFGARILVLSHTQAEL